MLALLAGVSCGLTLLLLAPYAATLASPCFFDADSSCNMPLTTLESAARPGLEQLAYAILRLESPFPAALGWLAALATLAGLRLPDRGRHGLPTFLLVASDGALGTYLLPHLAYWAICHFGFWVLRLLLQRQRNAACACALAAQGTRAQAQGAATGG